MPKKNKPSLPVFVDMPQGKSVRKAGQKAVEITDDERIVFAPDVTTDELRTAILEMATTIIEMNRVIIALQQAPPPTIISPFKNGQAS